MFPLEIDYTDHAEEKLKRLKDIGVKKEKVTQTLLKPDRIEDGYFGRKIAQRKLDENLVLRVVFEMKNI